MSNEEMRIPASMSGDQNQEPAASAPKRGRGRPRKAEAPKPNKGTATKEIQPKPAIETPNLRARELPQAFSDWGGISLPDAPKRGKKAKPEQEEGFGMSVGKRAWESMGGE